MQSLNIKTILQRSNYHRPLLFNGILWFLAFLILLFIFSCNSDYTLTKIKGERIEIDENLISDSSIEDFIKPYRENVNKNLDSVLSYSVDTYTKTDSEFNTAIGNLRADAVLEESNKKYYPHDGTQIILELFFIFSLFVFSLVSIDLFFQGVIQNSYSFLFPICNAFGEVWNYY